MSAIFLTLQYPCDQASKIKSEASEDMGSQVAERGEMSARTSREDAAAATLRGRTVLADVPGS
eukprot:309596-Rhodomonas_salina.2